MDAATLAQAMGNVRGVNYNAFVGPFNEAMITAQCTNVNRAAMWCAQLGHESVGLLYMNEIWGPTAAQRTYDGRMGNRRGTSDWSDFRGRGPIQLTGRDNYTAFSRWCFEKKLVSSPTYFADNPTLVAQPKWGFLAASWYWTVSRPNLNKWADERNVLNASREINGWVNRPNGLDDRTSRFNRCLGLGNRLLPTRRDQVAEKVLEYPRDQVLQDTFYNCGPASAQTIIRAATGTLIGERQLGVELRTTTNGTDWIGQFPNVLNKRIPGAQYRIVEMPNDPPTQSQKNRLWDDIVRSINAGHGVVTNIVVPPSNYPRAVWPSTLSPAYSGGTVYHYFAVMGYSDADIRRLWVADSGFPGTQGVTGYWVSLDQLATMIPPKGYAYSAAPSLQGEDDMFTDEDRKMLARVHHELTYPFQSRYKDPETGKQSTFKETLVGYILELDKKVESINMVRLPGLQKAIDAVTKFFSKGDK